MLPANFYVKLIFNLVKKPILVLEMIVFRTEQKVEPF